MLPFVFVGAVVELGFLGPFELHVDGGDAAPLGGLRQRALLAILALDANQVVSTDRLIDELWGENPPATAVHTVQVFVSRLRGALGAAGNRLITSAGMPVRGRCRGDRCRPLRAAVLDCAWGSGCR